ncbi:MAG: DUF1848 domain-containing protein [Gemmataceae bacterium]
MIISASYKTDIPTFYGEWFVNRLRAGFCKLVNPYNQRILRVPLDANDVHGFVFWTKNVGPFLRHLGEVRRLGIPFLVQHTINGYPRALEQAVVDSDKAVEHVRRIAEEYGPRVCVWRYDTVVHSTLTPREFHLKSFERLAKGLAGATDEVVISFAHLYQKTLRNMNRAGKEHDFAWSDPSDDWKRDLAAELAGIAAVHNIRLTVCSQPQYLGPAVGEARCVDAERLNAVGGTSIRCKIKGNRKECGCYESRDIGEYDTCPHGCVYCYAVREREVALDRFRRHDPESEFLFPPPTGATEAAPSQARIQLSLFDGLEDEQ